LRSLQIDFPLCMQKGGHFLRMMGICTQLLSWASV
jgi:hypothetical protein